MEKCMRVIMLHNLSLQAEFVENKNMYVQSVAGCELLCKQFFCPAKFCSQSKPIKKHGSHAQFPGADTKFWRLRPVLQQY